MKADIIDYLGKYEDGVVVLLLMSHNDEFTEATLYYSNEILVLTIDEKLEAEIGCPIELWEGYRELLVSILKRVVPYNEIINRLDYIDFSKYVTPDFKSTEGEDVDIKDVK